MNGTVGWYRKDFRLPDARAHARLGHALRVGQLPREGLAQRPPARPAHRRLPAVRAAPAAACSSATASTGSSCASTTAAARPTSRRRPRAADGVADRRLVELRRPAARGLPAQGRPRRLQRGPGPPEPALRDVRGDASTCRSIVRNYSRDGADASASPAASARAGRARHADDRRRALRRRSRATLRVSQPAAVVAGTPDLYDASLTRDASARARTRQAVAGYALRSGIRSIKVVGRPPAAQRPVR